MHPQQPQSFQVSLKSQSAFSAEIAVSTSFIVMASAHVPPDPHDTVGGHSRDFEVQSLSTEGLTAFLHCSFALKPVKWLYKSATTQQCS